jgi:DNA repair protein RecN (Recombination protein N)
MLVQLSIKNLAVIESVQIAFFNGFHVLSGETGAGKSIIIDALSLIIGGRGTTDLIRHGCDKAEIEALFELKEDHPVWDTLREFGIDADPEEYLIIRRELSLQGKSISRINGQLVNLSMLREVGESLVNIHGQHEHQSLLKVDQHLKWLDLYGDETIAAVKKQYQSIYEQYRNVAAELKELKDNSQRMLQMIDLYQFQLDEIRSAELVPGEDESLLAEKRKLSNVGKLMNAITDAYQNIYGQRGMDAIGQALTRLEEAAGYDPALKPVLEQLQSAYYQLEDVAYQLRDYRDQVEFQPEQLDQIERRLDLIAGLRRKYGDTVDAIIQYGENIAEQLQMMENKDERIQALQQEADVLYEQLVRLAGQLTALRKDVAAQMSAQIEQELAELHMERARFEVRFSQPEDPRGWDVDGRKIRFSSHGWDAVEFQISTNPGEPVKPLHKIASGGELSRIMLALKSIFARIDRIPVLVFDEVDTGVSGRAAQSIGEKLAKLSGSAQVFSITHLPQVACLADHQYEIRKTVDGERTITHVQLLSEKERIYELARMLGGAEVTATTLHHAEEMLKLANRKK